jgi:Zn-dependent protease
MDQTWLAEKLLILIPLWLSLSFHEWAHAWTAWKLGDDTAAMLGRMTLNPLAHVDPIGTILLPLLGIPFGWAKPVPVQPHRFSRRFSMRTGMMITAAAGPIANLVLAVIFILVYALMYRFHVMDRGPGESVGLLVSQMILLNVILATFNILPIPPLDGSRIADWLMPAALRPAWQSFCSLGPFALMAVIVLPQIAKIDLFHWPVIITKEVIYRVIMVFGG